MQQYKIAASVLAADFARLGQEVSAVLDAGADLIHFDVMDNHYVPNLTVGPAVCKSLINYGINAPLDVHLMVKPVDDLIMAFGAAGASRITIHPEATEHLDRSLQLIKQQGCQVGLAFNPATPLNYLEYVLDQLDSILIMSVNPGFGGQKFMPVALKKISEVKKYLAQQNKHISIQVDGGIKIDNIALVAKAGADNFVAGSAIFETNDYKQTIQAMRQQLTTAG